MFPHHLANRRSLNRKPPRSPQPRPQRRPRSPRRPRLPQRPRLPRRLPRWQCNRRRCLADDGIWTVDAFDCAWPAKRTSEMGISPWFDFFWSIGNPCRYDQLQLEGNNTTLLQNSEAGRVVYCNQRSLSFHWLNLVCNLQPLWVWNSLEGSTSSVCSYNWASKKWRDLSGLISWLIRQHWFHLVPVLDQYDQFHWRKEAAKVAAQSLDCKVTASLVFALQKIWWVYGYFECLFTLDRIFWCDIYKK